MKLGGGFIVADDALEPPLLTAVRAAQGDVLELARAAWAGDDDALEALDADHLYAVAEWGLRELADSPRGQELALVCSAFGRPPSEYLGITDAGLACSFDVWCLDRLAPDGSPAEAPSESAVRFSVSPPSPL